MCMLSRESSRLLSCLIYGNINKCYVYSTERDPCAIVYTNTNSAGQRYGLLDDNIIGAIGAFLVKDSVCIVTATIIAGRVTHIRS